jgi:hypothetical protein
MLLRRVTDHIKQQNWFAVFIDFLIVVVGILIAFQITNWADRRADIRALDTALKLLQDELKVNIVTMDAKSKLQAEIATAGKELLQLIRDPELDKVPMDQIGQVFVDGYTTDYSTSALSYVLAQEPFQNTQNTQLRKTVTSLPSRFEDALDDERITIHLLDNHWVPYISQHVPVETFWNDAFKNREWPFFVSTERSSEYATNGLLEFKQLAATLEFQNEIVNRIGYQTLILNEQQLLRDALKVTLVLIEEELN